MRSEHDMLGTLEIPKESYAGIHTQRALENFAVSGYKVDEDLIRAYGLVKLACMKTIFNLEEEEKRQKEKGKRELTQENCSLFNYSTQTAVFQACEELAEGKLSQYMLVDALQGGAGTSLNMNVNEVIANRALEILG